MQSVTIDASYTKSFLSNQIRVCVESRLLMCERMCVVTRRLGRASHARQGRDASQCVRSSAGADVVGDYACVRATDGERVCAQ
jgi:hypothetical protein